MLNGRDAVRGFIFIACLRLGRETLGRHDLNVRFNIILIRRIALYFTRKTYE